MDTRRDGKERHMRTAVLCAILVICSGVVAATRGQVTQPVNPAATRAGTAVAPAPITSGWVLLKEGEAEGTIEADAKHSTNGNPHLLKISVTKYPAIGKGRLGAKNTNAVVVKQGAMFDVTFNGTMEGTANYGVGLVFSLETDDGKVLARTTLAEIGRAGVGRRGGGAWPSYLVSLRARGAANNAHLTITAIEPFPVWLDNIVLVERDAAQ